MYAGNSWSRAHHEQGLAGAGLAGYSSALPGDLRTRSGGPLPYHLRHQVVAVAARHAPRAARKVDELRVERDGLPWTMRGEGTTSHLTLPGVVSAIRRTVMLPGRVSPTGESDP